MLIADGSFPNNRAVSPNNPSGWGFALCTSAAAFTRHLPVSSAWLSFHGLVKTSPLDEHVLLPLDGSNITEEMRAIIELVDYILYYSQLPPGSRVIVYQLHVCYTLPSRRPAPLDTPSGRKARATIRYCFKIVVSCRFSEGSIAYRYSRQRNS